MDNKEHTREKRRRFRFLKILIRIFAGLLLLILILILFVRSPWGQNLIVQQLVSYVSDKTQTEVSVEKFYLRFNGNLVLKGLYLEDQKKDTLLYSDFLEADIQLLPLLTGKGFGIDYLDWKGLRASISREDSIRGFNFQFLQDAFAASDTLSEKEDKSSPFQLILGEIHLSDFIVKYDDAVSGLESKIDLGEIFLLPRKIDLETMNFQIEKLAVSDSDFDLRQTKSAPEEETEETGILPFLAVNQLTLHQVSFNFNTENNNTENKLDAQVAIGDLLLELKQADLENNIIEIGEFRLQNSVAALSSQTVPKVEKTETPSSPESFQWPDWEFSAEKINLEKNRFSYFENDQKIRKNVFNPQAVAVSGFDLHARSVFLKDKKGGIELRELSFVEASGIDFKNLSFTGDISDSSAGIKKLNLSFNDNFIEGSLQAQYSGLAALLENPEVKIDLPDFRLNLKEIFRFSPELKKNENLEILSRYPLSGNISASGSAADFRLSEFRLNWGKSTSVAARARLFNLTDPDQLRIDLPDLRIKSAGKDLAQFVQEENLQFPEEIFLTASAKGSLQDILAEADLKTSQGTVVFNGKLKQDPKIDFAAGLKIDYQLNELLQNENLGLIDLELEAAGSGNEIEDLDADFDLLIAHLEFQDHDLQNWEISGKVRDGEGDLFSRYKDDNLDFDLNASVVLDSVFPDIRGHLDLKGINLQAFGLMKKDVRTALKLDVEIDGDEDSMDIITTVGEGVVIADNKTYLLGDLLATAYISKDSTSMWLDNKMLQLTLESNADPGTFGKSVQQHLSRHFSEKIISDSISKPVNLHVYGRIAQAPVLNQVFLENVKDLDTIHFDILFDENIQKLTAGIRAPHINYSDNEMEELLFSLDSDSENLNFDLGFASLKAGPLQIPKTDISGKMEERELFLSFLAVHRDSNLMQVDSKLTGNTEDFNFRIIPDNLILNSHRWQIPENNEIHYTKNKIDITDFVLSHREQEIELFDSEAQNSELQTGIRFENFRLSEILNYLNPEEQLAKGILDGNITVVNPFDTPGIDADLSVSRFNLLDTDLGVLSLQASSAGNQGYDFYASLKEGNADLDLTGQFSAGENSELDARLVLNQLKIQALEGFSMGEIREGSGTVSGLFEISGPVNDLAYSGNFHFEEAGFTVDKFNAKFSLKDENINFDNSGIEFESFHIYDENSNWLVVDGKIKTEDLSNPEFDLSIAADDFQILNAPREDNSFLYGLAAFDLQARLTGDLHIPKLEAFIHVDDQTDFTYILPASAVAIEERDGVVLFVNRADPDAVLTQAEKKTATISGFDIAVHLEIGRQARIGLIIDPQTNDNFEIFGDGDLIFTMNPNGIMSLSGIYEIAGGHYEMNLYNIVNRRFDLVEGSRVSWSGDPFDAALDVRAVYEVKASASPLMAPVTSGADPSETNKYKQVLPFLVYLDVDGELEKPEISFALDMAEDEKGAVGGQVYGRLQQVNQQEGELNRQVFSLLVMNRFYPEAGSDGSRGGFATIARDNLNDAISDQLNAFSDKILGDTGVELDFGLNSYTDYQGETAQERTQLDIAAQKKLFDDRLIVRVGSEVDIQGSNPQEESTPLIGNVSIEYLITESGRYRIKGFRKNTFENVIDGQTIVNGIALIFTQEFNRFRELWQREQTRERKKKSEKTEVEDSGN